VNHFHLFRRCVFIDGKSTGVSIAARITFAGRPIATLQSLYENIFRYVTWIPVIDADNLILGRLASHCAKLLLNGEEVTVVNAEKSVISGSKKSITSDYKEKRDIVTPLEKYDLSQLKLTGIIHSPSGDRALVEESSGRGYVVTIGTYIGIHSGKVSEIAFDRIIIEEEGEDSLGKISILKKELLLQKPPGE